MLLRVLEVRLVRSYQNETIVRAAKMKNQNYVKSLRLEKHESRWPLPSREKTRAGNPSAREFDPKITQH